MDKFTKEQQVQAVYDLKVGYTLGHADIAMLKSMARQLLTSMEQEPVAYMQIDGDEIEYNGHNEFSGGGKGAPLYAAPQLPQPAVLSVPDKIPKLKDGRGYKYVKEGVRYSVNYASGWNACRAAMLQAGKSPVTPDGYVLVPKEPTEAMMLHKSGCNDHPWDDPECVMRQTRRLVWAHMLEAAAPQEEVKK